MNVHGNVSINSLAKQLDERTGENLEAGKEWKQAQKQTTQLGH